MRFRLITEAGSYGDEEFTEHDTIEAARADAQDFIKDNCDDYPPDELRACIYQLVETVSYKPNPEVVTEKASEPTKEPVRDFSVRLSDL